MPIRAWLSRLAALTLVPAGILLAAELSLRLAGFGFPADFLLASSTHAERSISNQRFGWRFFPPALSRAPLPVELDNDDSFRIFVVGGSAALGTPEPAFGFPRILETMLEQTHPGASIEVVSATMAAINSHVVREVVRDCARQQPDLFLVYMGNNEIVGPYGAGTVFGDFSPSLGLIRSAIAVKATRIGQLIRRSVAPETTDEWRGMEMFLEKRVANDDQRLERVYSHFTENLADIVHSVRASGAEVVLATVAVNLRDQPPFASSPPTQADSDLFFELLATARHRLAAEDPAGALEALNEASSLGDRSAELHYERGRILLALGRIDEARSELVLARDLDTLRFRADSRINQVIRDVATREKVELVDIDEIFRSTLPGYRYFHEHVHFNFSGNYTVAKALFGAASASMLRASLPASGRLPSPSEVAERLAFGRYDLLSIEEDILEMVSRPPFLSRHDLAAHVTARRLRIANLRASLSDQAWLHSAERYEERLAQKPDDLHTRARYAELLGRYGSKELAADHWRYLVDRIPEIPDWQSSLAMAWSAMGQTENALALLEDAIELWPDLAPRLLVNLGIVNERAGRTDDAEAAYRRALEMRSGFRLALANLATLAAKRGDLDEAMQGWRSLIELYPDFVEAHHDLGVALEMQGQLEAAAESFRREIASRPTTSRGYVSLGIVLEQLGRPQEALDRFRQALELDPFSTEALFMTADLLLSHDRPEAALTFYHRGLELDPKNAQARENLELALRER